MKWSGVGTAAAKSVWPVSAAISVGSSSMTGLGLLVEPLHGVMRVYNAAEPVDAPNSYGGLQVDPSLVAEPLWYADGEMVRAAYTLRDDDWGQAGALVRQVLDAVAR